MSFPTRRVALGFNTCLIDILTRVSSSIELVPSSARSTGSSATPLPSQLAPLLDDTLQRVKAILEKAVPLGKKRTALEEAEFEDEDDEGALEREILMQSQCCLRVYDS